MVRNRPSVDPFTSNRRGASTAVPMRRNAQSESYEEGPESLELPAGADSFSSGREEAVKGVNDSGPAEVTVEKKVFCQLFCFVLFVDGFPQFCLSKHV
jgi:hypothetical protein